jgi:virulence-associated protein VapD
MFAVAFDLIVEETQARHPRSVPSAYADVAITALKAFRAAYTSPPPRIWRT